LHGYSASACCTSCLQKKRCIAITSRLKCRASSLQQKAAWPISVSILHERIAIEMLHGRRPEHAAQIPCNRNVACPPTCCLQQNRCVVHNVLTCCRSR
jgi:hypothetical protein